jgi:mono/diheme cytochrome c family protein
LSRRRRAAAGLALAALVGVPVFLTLTRPRPLEPGALPARTVDLANGATIYRAGGCFGCHQPPAGAPGDEPSLPAGGAAFPTPVGTFYPGNLTPDPETGLGHWSEQDFLSAMVRGVSPDGLHYFPAFPYPAYATMRVDDLRDLWAYLHELPAVRSPGRDPSLPLLPFARRAVGLWKRLEGDARPFLPDPAKGATWNRGAYLVSAPGHCGECHTPRNVLMIRDESFALAGGPHPAGDGHVPSLRRLVARGRYADAADLALALQYGETLGYDELSSGGMGKIQTELAQLPAADLAAIAEYLIALD